MFGLLRGMFGLGLGLGLGLGILRGMFWILRGMFE